MRIIKCAKDSFKLGSNYLGLLLFLSIIRIMLSEYCSIPGIIDNPQFTTPITKGTAIQILRDYGLIKFYYAYFILDFIWALVLLFGIFVFICKSWNCKCAKKWIPIFLLLCCATYLIDLAENTYYLICYEYPKIIASVKMLAYGIVTLIWLATFLIHHYHKYAKVVIEFLKSSIYSLIIIVIIGFLLPEVKAVNSLVVNLYNHPIQMILLLFLFAPLYSVALAHYPSYFNIDQDKREWFRDKVFIRGLNWISVISYRNKKVPDNDNEAKRNFMYRALGLFFYAALIYMIGFTSEVNFNWRFSTKVLAVGFFVLGLFILYWYKKKLWEWYQENKNVFEERLPFYYHGDFIPHEAPIEGLTNLKNNIKGLNDLKNNIKGLNDEEKNRLAGIKHPVRIFLCLVSLTVVLHIIFFILLFRSGYTACNVKFSLICIFLQGISYACYRGCRSALAFIFFPVNENSSNSVSNVFTKERAIRSTNELYFKAMVKGFFENDPLKMNNLKGFDKLLFNKSFGYGLFNSFPTKKWNISLAMLSSNVKYLKINGILFILNLVGLVVLNFRSDWSIHFNAILIALSAIMIIYSALVLLTKTYIFCSNSKGEETSSVGVLKFFKPFIITSLILIALYGASRKYPNKLYTLAKIKKNENEKICFDKFVCNLDPITRYYIGAYGGGMKSNAWTMTVLQKLAEEDPNFLKRAVVISGASGGSMGLMNWSAILANSDKNNSINENIKRISTSNPLSLDITHILGRDFILYGFLPRASCVQGQDRSSRVMKQYAGLAENASTFDEQTPYRDFFKNRLYKKFTHFPALIANSTNILGNQGMAVSVYLNPNSMEYDLLYNGANNIIDLDFIDETSDSIIPKVKPKTLSFYDAVSTSNRFPLVSSSAHIITLGQFNDGGIYENSGLLSAYKFYESIKFYEKSQGNKSTKARNVFINIVNDKNLYIRNLIETKFGDSIKIKKKGVSSEIKSIIKAVASTEMMPIYIKQKLKNLEKNKELEFYSLYLPHTFTTEDIINLYGKEIVVTGISKDSLFKKLDSITRSNNCSIKNHIQKSKKEECKNAIVEPPMSRLMSPQAYNFMVQMVNNDLTIKNTIKDIKGKK